MRKNLRVLYHDNALTGLASAAVFSRFIPLSLRPAPVLNTKVSRTRQDS